MKGAAADATAQVSLVAIRLLEVPLLLHFWGAELYGAWLIVTAIPTYLTLSDFGFMHVAAREVVMQASGGRTERALATYQSTAALVGTISSILAIAFLAIVSSVPIEVVFGIVEITRIDTIIIAALFGCKIIVHMQTGMLGATLQSVGKYPLFFSLSAAILVAEFLALAVVVSLGGGVTHAASAMIAAIAFGFLLTLLIARRAVPWLKLGVKEFELGIVQQLFRPATAALAFPFSQALNFQGTVLIIASLLGPASVATFSAHRQLAGFVTRTNFISRSINVELGRAFGNQDSVSFRHLSFRSFGLLFWCALIAALAILVVSPFAFGFWVGDHLPFHFDLLIPLLAVAVIDLLWRAAFNPLEATNRHLRLARTIVPTNIAMLGVMYLLCERIGITGAPYALLLASVVTLIAASREFLKLTNSSYSDLISSIIRLPLMALRGTI